MATLTELRSPSGKRDSPYRRSNKPLMEKRRRARINSCLTQLKALVLEAMRKDSTQYSKLEKADILEMTVKHLRNLQRQQVATSVSRDPNLVPKYRAGFNECAQEVVRYLGSAREVSDDIRGRLLNHLGNCMETLDKVQPNIADAKQQTISQPINVHIPPQSQQINTGVPTVQSGYLLMPANVQTSPILVHSSQIVTVPQGQCNTSPFIQNNSAQHVASNTTVPFGQSRNVSNENALPRTVQANPKCAPPRTKASLKAYDTTVFKPVTPEEPKSNSPPLFFKNSSFYSHKDFISTCCRTPSPLKEEKVWRPW